MKERIPISVCMPVYNRHEYIKECIDSILSQTFTEFELLIVDDGSTDDTCDIILSYHDPRIRLIRNRHDFIESSNTLLRQAQGKYIARMDSDDIMMPDRLKIQYEYMEEHPDVDILGGGMEMIGNVDEPEQHTYIEDVTVDELYKGCWICNPTSMMRRQRIIEKGLKYDDEGIYAEDYLFWAKAAMAGLRIKNIPQILVRYRISDSQVSTAYHYIQSKGAKYTQSLISRWYAREEEEWALHHPVTIPKTGNQLTVIIPFLNEKEEVAQTVKSIRDHVGNRVDIIVINDQSNDGYDYRKDLEPYQVSYIYNIERKGVAASRDYGVELCTTPYFLLLDAHMRFYDNKWVDIIVQTLLKNDRQLLCCQTKVLKKSPDGHLFFDESAATTYGAYLQFQGTEYIPSIIWNYREHHKDQNSEAIPAVLGAGYATSIRYWTRLKGLEGLKLYGSDEAYISLKVWLEGGKCILLKNIEIGHLYRKTSPYKRYHEEEIYNRLFIANVLMPQDLICKTHAIALHKNKYSFLLALQMLKEKEQKVKELKNHYKESFSIPFQDIKNLHLKDLPINKEYLYIILSRLPDIKEHQSEHVPENPGIFDGKTAYLIWLCHYNRYTHQEKWDEQTNDIWKDILRSIHSESLIWNFRNGLCGIGWGILYLYFHKMIKESIIVPIAQIDGCITKLNIKELDDYSFPIGLGGLFAYLSLRMRFEEKLPLTETYLKILDQAAAHVLNSKTELASYYYAILYLNIRKNGTDPDNELPDINEWLDAPNVIPNNPRFWNMALMEGILGTSLKAMLTYNNLN